MLNFCRPAALTCLLGLSPLLAWSQSAPCHQGNFEAFVQAYAADPALQAAATLLPLPRQTLDDAGQPVQKALPRAELNFPLLPAPDTQKSLGQELRLLPPQGDTHRAVLLQHDSDWMQVFSFRKTPCWQLVGLKDGAP